MESWEVSMEIDLIAIPCFYHLEKTLAIHVAKDSIGLAGLNSMEREG